jgi:hypothetical protein
MREGLLEPARGGRAARGRALPPCLENRSPRGTGRSTPLNNGKGREENELLAPCHSAREALRGQLLEPECGSAGCTGLDIGLETGFHPAGNSCLLELAPWPLPISARHTAMDGPYISTHLENTCMYMIQNATDPRT